MATAHDHDHSDRSGAALTAAAERALVGAGEQWTTMRAAVFSALTSFDKPASAYDVTDAVSTAQGRRVAANSVYRILDLFVANNVAMRVESANAYLANAHPDCLHDCIFLVCDTCGRATHVDDDQLSARIRETARATGFRPEKPVIEVRGRCGDCAAPAAAAMRSIDSAGTKR
ncbi:Fur family transcriptional regulator [Polymorphobacter fuscus]|uniref:Transcriptional repressor n=1 Tax=Sandarakinorhabdus fusca TaxID=1439888 RepID=A0A7C9GP75_9SPHN|nr:transcriptional repressor [Polymorphobacter fuscus]KAB7646134.1 transcriptional repressor [Polymorphobacter fuscus]MQT17332.1 transcriptional repressor [Polymorphobacter fuscus]NJC10135.1 Fur family zinc uptake transcriptional regulator [Polymorphobacter fuscus]